MPCFFFFSNVLCVGILAVVFFCCPRYLLLYEILSDLTYTIYVCIYELNAKNDSNC